MFFGTTPSINDLLTIHDRQITIDLDELKDKRRGKMNDPVYISIPFPRLQFWDRNGAEASFNNDPTGIEFALNITTKEFIKRLEKVNPTVDGVGRNLKRYHVVLVLLSVDYDAEKDEGIITITRYGHLIHLQNFSLK
jgi:hypothetical protein